MPRRTPPRGDATGEHVEVHPVTPDRWNDLVDLFERKGPRGGTPATDWCWCMWWRARSHDRDANRREMRGLATGGDVPGLLAYEDGKPVAWVSVAPREQHRQLTRSPALKPTDPDEDGVFSLVCFYVYPTARRRGMIATLIEAAIEHARAHGARCLEAYPSRRPTTGMSSDFMGSLGSFLSSGFEPVRETRGRTIVRRHM